MKENSVLNGRYKIIRPIGYGGMAEVYLAQDLLLDREVAIKMLRDQFLSDNELLEQFKREAKSAARLVHPNIINIYDVMSVDNNEYIVMEYVDGVTLKEYLVQNQLSVQTALELAAQLAAGLEHAHSRKIIHCDIKPQNILVDKNMQAKIADFGIAKMVTSQTMVYSKSVMGSVHYISPEQASGEKITAASDIYSLGVVLFEMLTGRVPYSAATAVSVAMMHVEKPVPQLKDFLVDVPEGLQAIIDKALAKRAEARYVDACAFRKALLALLHKLYPYTNDNAVTQETVKLAQAQERVAKSATTEEGATMIMKPVRAQVKEEPEVIEPVISEKNEEEDAVSVKVPQGKVVKRKINWIRVMLFVTALVVAISFMARSIFSSNKTIEVPNVIKMTAQEAQSVLKKQEFKVKIEERTSEDKNAKPGMVLEQSPKAGDKRKQGSTITLYVAKLGELKDVPDLQGVSLTQVEERLLEAGFKMGKIEKKHIKGERIGTVLEQDPKANEKAPKGSEINIVINEGDKEVPNLVGKSLEDAQKLLQKAGLRMGEVKKINDASAKKNVVLASNPSAGIKISEGDAVSVSVAQGSGVKKKVYRDFVVPGNKIVNVRIVLEDENGSTLLYTGSQRGGVRIRQPIEYVEPAKVQFFCDNKLEQELSL